MQEEEQILSEKLENKKDLKRALNTEDMIREDESITFYIKNTLNTGTNRRMAGHIFIFLEGRFATHGNF